MAVRAASRGLLQPQRRHGRAPSGPGQLCRMVPLREANVRLSPCTGGQPNATCPLPVAIPAQLGKGIGTRTAAVPGDYGHAQRPRPSVRMAVLQPLPPAQARQ